VQDWRNEIEAGRLIGPRIYTPGPMLDGPKPRFPSSVAIATPEDAHRAVADLKRGARILSAAIADSARRGFCNSGRSQEARDAVRRARAGYGARQRDVRSGMKSFEHLIGIFEGSRGRGRLLEGNKTEGGFLAHTIRARCFRMRSCKESTLAMPDAVWERGGNLIDASDFQQDTRAKLVCRIVGKTRLGAIHGRNHAGMAGRSGG